MAVALLALPLVLVPIGAGFLLSKRDAVVALTAYLALLWLLPGRYVVPGAGRAGTPAMAVALACAGWWVISRLLPRQGLAEGSQPIRFALFVYGWWFLLTYALAFRRVLTAVEVTGADRAMITMVASTGVALLAADGIETRDRLETLLRRIVLFAAIVAAIGIVQFMTDFDPVALIRVPGLELNGEIVASQERSIFDRPHSTALHPIEFAVVCAIVLPIALHFAFHDRAIAHATPARRRVARLLPVFLIATAVPMTVSRSGVLGLVVGMGVASIAWDWRRRLNVAVAGVFFLMAMRLVVPGLLGTLRSLIVGAENDPSVQGRLADLVFVRQYVAETPVLGRGPGTFNPIQYFFLDNQLYGTWISSGFVGLLALLVLVATGIVVSARAGKHLDDESRSLGYAVAASIAVAGVSMATFDGEAFHIYNGTLFVLLGSAGAFWRLTIGHRRQFVLAAGHGE